MTLFNARPSRSLKGWKEVERGPTNKFSRSQNFVFNVKNLETEQYWRLALCGVRRVDEKVERIPEMEFSNPINLLVNIYLEIGITEN